MLVGVFWFSSQDAPEETMTQEDASMTMEGSAEPMGDRSMMEEEGDVMMEEDDMMMESSGVYETYDAAKLASAEDGDVVLFFRASWCPTCRALDADIRENMSDIPADVTILDVDYDEYSDLKQQYGVTTQHTLVQVDSEGNEIAKWVGSSTLDDVLAKVE